jgi:hypothetical protein
MMSPFGGKFGRSLSSASILKFSVPSHYGNIWSSILL